MVWPKRIGTERISTEPKREVIMYSSVYLYITVSHKTVKEIMAQYGFTEDQKAPVAERLAQDSSMWPVEGNSDDSCRENHYTVGYYEILGYGIPAY